MPRAKRPRPLLSKQEGVIFCSIQHPPPCRRITMSSSISSCSSSLLVPPDSKKVCEMYFGKNPVVGNESKWKCTCGTVRSQNVKLGYSNLMSHIKQKHTNYLDMFVLTEQANEDRQEAAGHSAALSRSTGVLSTGSRSMSSVSGQPQQTTLNFMMDTRSNNVFTWLEWKVMDEHEKCEKTLTRCNTRLEPISVKTLKKYLFKVVDAVGKKVTARTRVAVSYALVFHGWSEASRHFIGVFIVYPGKHGCHNGGAPADPVMHLLAFAPLVDETNFTADNHMNFIKATLEWFSIPLERLFCLIRDNCSTNKATANRLGVPLLGCRRQRFNLSVEQYLRTFLASESELVGKLMSKLSTLKQSG